MSIIVVEKFYYYTYICNKCKSNLMFHNEDIIDPDNDMEHIICPVCGERNYL